MSIPSSGRFIVLGSATGPSPTPGAVTVPDGTTHFSFSTATKTNSHCHVLVGGQELIVQVGLPIALHSTASKPVISNNTSNTFDKVTFLKIEYLSKTA